MDQPAEAIATLDVVWSPRGGESERWLLRVRRREVEGAVGVGLRLPFLALITAAICSMVLAVAGCSGSSGSTGGAGDFCDTHACIDNFDNGDGYVVQCADGTWSQSGGKPGACSWHGGEGP